MRRRAPAVEGRGIGLAQTLSSLIERFHEIDDLERAAGVLDWDQKTYMPMGGLSGRGEQLASLGVVIHERLASPELGELLDRLAEEVSEAPPDDLRRPFLRTARRAHDQAVKLTPSLVAKQARVSVQAYERWMAARKAKDFRIFAPAFTSVLDVSREMAEALGYPQEPYDALLDHAEQGMTAASAAQLLDELKATLVPLIARIVESPHQVDRSILFGHFPEEAQWRLMTEAVEAFGYDFGRGRLDRTIHPFETSFGIGDVRITTRVVESYFPAGLFGTMHESGHGMYEQGLSAEWGRTPLGKPVSGGIHESQSRFWENFVGRSRAFWHYFLPRAQAAFPSLADATAEDVYRAVSAVQPSFIRVEADEVTYNLHIAVRFEVERALLRGELAVQDVPDAWNAKMQAYLGIAPPDDLLGALQDVHWTHDLGGFLTYTVGNVAGGQLWQAANRSIEDLSQRVGRGDFAPLLDFLRRNVHQVGSRETRDDMLRHVTGEPLTTRPYLEYIQAKFQDIYKLP